MKGSAYGYKRKEDVSVTCAELHVANTVCCCFVESDARGTADTAGRLMPPYSQGALCLHDRTIATDSKTAMHAIHKQIHNPRGNQYNTHKELLKAIALELLRRAQTGLCTEIIKVKSHIGIEGNEVADKLANAAQEPDACDVSYDVGHLAHQGEHWPVLIAHPQRDQARHRDRMAGNLLASLKKHIACEHAKGLTNHGMYLDLWNKIRADVHKTSHAYWTAPHKVIKNIIHARFGGLYSQKLACRYGHAHDDSCPLCSMPDSAGHILGECTQTDMKSIVIGR